MKGFLATEGIQKTNLTLGEEQISKQFCLDVLIIDQVPHLI